MEHYLIEVRFYDDYGSFNPNSKKYVYKVPKDVHLDVSDEVVVRVDTNTRDRKYNCVRVVNVMKDEKDSEFKLKWIVQKVDEGSYFEKIQQEKEFKKLVNILNERRRKASLVELMRDVATPEELEKLKKFLG